MFLWSRERTNGQSSYPTCQWWTITSSFEDYHGHEVSQDDSLPIRIVIPLLQELNGYLTNTCNKNKEWGHLHFTGTELKSSYLMMGVTSGHSDGHVTRLTGGVATVT